MEIFAPQIDNIIEHLQSNPELVDLEIYNKLKAINKEICCIKPKEDDDIRELWLEVSRGTIKNFGKFEEYKKEELVETYEQFERLWIDYYPDEKKWYEFTTSKYQEKLFFFFDSKLIFSINETEEPEKEKKYIDKDIYKFLTWLFYRVKKETGKLKQNVETYNRYLEKNLSYHKRFGRIKRNEKDLEHIHGKYAQEAIQPIFLCMLIIWKISGV
ncbi:MAG: hypothetical protein KAU01_08245 [Candidatus Cloacimonetes bacterium]|nr:hypothetical protein [Candidatus Cloacimonadota bacterium]